MLQAHPETGRERPPIVVLLRLSWPAILEQLLLTAANYIDTAMVGALGTNATASVAINSSVCFLLLGLFAAAGVGYSVQVAHALGGNDQIRARTAAHQAATGGLLIGLGAALCILPLSRFIPQWLGAEAAILPDARRYLFFYGMGLPLQSLLAVLSAVLRCSGDTRTPLLFNAGANVLNLCFNFLFIFPTRDVVIWNQTFSFWGASLGVSGAAIGTALSNGLMGLSLMVYMTLHKSTLQLVPDGPYCPQPAVVRRALSLGAPVFLERACFSCGQLFMTRLVTSLGNVSLAANHVAVTAEAISYLPAQGVSFAATAVVGQAVGGNRPALARQYGRLSGRIGLASGFLAGILLFTLAHPLAGIFSPDQDVISLAAQMLQIVAISEPLYGLSIVLGGVLRGTGDSRTPFFTILIGMWAVRMPLAPILVFGFGFGLSAVWIAMVADLMFRGILCQIFVSKINWERLSSLVSGSVQDRGT